MLPLCHNHLGQSGAQHFVVDFNALLDNVNEAFGLTSKGGAACVLLLKRPHLPDDLDSCQQQPAQPWLVRLQLVDGVANGGDELEGHIHIHPLRGLLATSQCGIEELRPGLLVGAFPRRADLKRALVAAAF